jgi:bifunctional non-homologous end joining protein LigD
VSLRQYQSKRHFSQTPEPRGAKGKSSGTLRFVIQKHAARSLHYDFRLEAAGVLKSWAVPKGPSLNPEEKRLAVMVEDHPLEYGDFEGIIPKGNYGAGTVMVWDHGTYSIPGQTDTEKAIREGLAKGRFHLILKGKKLRGEFALFKIKSEDEKNWLLRKIQDDAATDQPLPDDDLSVLSSRTMADITDNRSKPRSARKKSKIDLSDAPRGAMPTRVKPMLATAIDQPFDRAGWLFEVKWDGYRAIAEVAGGEVRLYSRNNQSFEEKFAPVVETLRDLGREAVLDGEIVVVDNTGKANFQLLQNYLNSQRGNLVYYVFDLLYLDGHDLRSLPLLRRKELVTRIIAGLPNVKLSDHVLERGLAFFEAVSGQHLEGMVAKDGKSRYHAGIRGQSWLKIKCQRRQEAVIGGFTAPRGERKHLGSLVLGVFEQGDFVYIGHAGTGFSDSTLDELEGKLTPLIQKECPFKKKPKANAPVHWVKPELVCEVGFGSWTGDGYLRHPVYMGLRSNKPAATVRRETDADAKSEPTPPEPKKETAPTTEIPATGRLSVNGVTVQLTNLNKVYWPDEGYAKGDLIHYYREVSSAILPYLRDRPESLHRHPGGIKEQSFFQKDIRPQKPPAWVPTAMLPSDPGDKDTQAVLCQDEATLLYLANLGCIELNPWNSRIQALDLADYLLVDLDPENIDFDRVVDAAVEFRRLLEQIDAEGYCKTSGKRGLHVYVPLGARYTHDQAKQFAELLVQIVHRRLPAFTSLVRDPRKRQNRVYLDYLQNGKGKTLAAPYCVRPYPGATVSTPLHWQEVKRRLDPSRFTMRTLPRRLDRVGDVWQAVLGPGIDVMRCLEKVALLKR